MIEKNPFNITVNFYDRNLQGTIIVEKNCNAVLIVNLGDSIATINGAFLFPSPTPATDAGDSLTLGGNLGDIYRGQLVLSFPVATIGANPQVQVIQQYYVE